MLEGQMMSKLHHNITGNNFVSQKNENFILNHLFKIENHFKHAHAFF